MPLITSNIGLISIVSSADSPENILEVYDGDVAVVYQEPSGTYIEGWTQGDPDAAIFVALDGCHTQTGLPANDRGPAS